MIVPNEAMTHAGRFHADDVFSAALLRIVNPAIKIYRKNNIPDGFSGLVFDLANGDFDHHGNKKSIRPNGVAYASFGLLWKELGPKLVGDDSARIFDESFVQLLDIQDNEGGNNQLARAITQANPKWDSTIDADSCFFKTVEFAKFILQNEIDSMKSTKRARQKVLNALKHQQDGIITLDVGIPWKGILIPQPVYYVVYPSARGGFNAQAVPVAMGSQECKRPFPLEWRGKSTEEIEKLIGVSNISFCHLGGYLLNALTLEEAVKACKIANKLV